MRTKQFFGGAPLCAGVLLFALVACEHNKREVTVPTRNLYIGAVIDQILRAESFEEVVGQVTVVWQAVHETDFTERAKALADEIVEAEPDFVGLQEVALWRIQSPGDMLVGGTTPAEDVEYDFLDLLLDALQERGAKYSVVLVLEGFDAEMPILTGDDVRLTDRDVILARADLAPGHLKVLDTDSGYYETVLSAPIGGEGGPVVTLLRGWGFADVSMRGRKFRFLHTHLESDFAVIQEAQAAELVAGPAVTDLDVICLGDFNSDAYGVGTLSYEIMLDAGFEDCWSEANPLDPGLTWGHAPELTNDTSTFSERIDFVFYRGAFAVTDAYVVGEEPEDKTDSGLWPSDHGGVVATLEFVHSDG